VQDSTSLVALLWAIQKTIEIDENSLEELSNILNVSVEEIQELLEMTVEEYESVLDYTYRH